MSVADFTLIEDAPPVTIEEFLALPDNGVQRELIQGRIRELGMTVRNRFHSRIEAAVAFTLVGWLRVQPPPRGEVVCGEAGFRPKGTKESLVGIDVALVSADLVARTDQRETTYDGAPILAVEILSPEDTLQAMREKAAEYRLFGVHNIWIIDPEARIAYRYVETGLEEVRTDELTVPGTPIRVVLGEMFAELDRV